MNVRPLAKLLVNRPKTVLLVFTIITIVIGLNIKNIYMQSDLSGFLPKDDPSLQLWDRIYQEFDVKSSVIIYVEADDIRDPVVLKEMDRVSSKINTYENDRGEQDDIFSVQSLASLIKDENSKAYVIGGVGGTGKNEIPEDTGLISKYLARTTILATKGILYTNTYKVAVIIIQLKHGANVNEVLTRTKDAIDHRGTDYSEMTITGGIASQKAMQKHTLDSLYIVFILAIVFVSINIYFFHRNFKSFIIAFLPLGYSLILTFGVFGVVHPEMTILTIAAIALLIGLGDDYAVYYSSRFAEECTAKDAIERVEFTLKRTGKAVVMCVIATIIGFASLMTSNMPPMVAFGFVCLLGAAFVFISATILVPCLCIILKFEKHEANHHWKRFAGFVVDNRKRFFVVGCVVVILSLIVLPQVKTDVNFTEMAPQGIPEVETLLKYSENFGGSTNFNAILIETDSQGLTYPEVIEAICNMEAKMREAGASVSSIASEIKKANDVLDRNQIMEKISDYLGVDKIIFDKIAKSGLVDKDFSKTVIIVSFPVEKSVQELEQLVNSINSIGARAVIPHNGHVSQLAGQDVVTVEVNNQIMSTQISSMTTEILLILACLILGFKSTRIGFLSIIPVLFVLAWEPGALITLGIPLSVINITIAAIIVSTGIDYGIVIAQRLKEERARGYSKVDALKKTIETSGWSIVTASSTTMVALLATFAVDIPMIHQFSIVVIVLYTLSVVASFCILPAVYSSKWFE